MHLCYSLLKYDQFCLCTVAYNTFKHEFSFFFISSYQNETQQLSNINYLYYFGNTFISSSLVYLANTFHHYHSTIGRLRQWDKHVRW